MDRHNISDQILQAALDYAANGMLVFPCRPAATPERKAKEPLIKGGFTSASNDPDQIRWWWSKYPFAMIGVPTGLPGSWDVLDIDCHEGAADGRVHLAQIEEAGLLEGWVKLVRTASGGMHFYYPASGVLRNGSLKAPDDTGKMKPIGVDFRGLGGFVIVPPSRLFSWDEDGTRCCQIGAWTVESEMPREQGNVLQKLEISKLLVPTSVPREVPRFRSLGIKLHVRAGDQPSVDGVVNWLGQQGDVGDRNNSLFWAACTVIESNGDPWVLEDVALAIGLDPSEIRNTILSAMHTTEAPVLLPEAPTMKSIWGLS